MTPVVAALVPGVLDKVASVIDDVFTTDEERAQLYMEERRLEAGLAQGQQEVNKAQAHHPSVFVAGPRPAAMWVAVAGLAYQFLLYPLMTWGWALGQARGLLPAELAPPPVLDFEELMVLLAGLLGLGWMRSKDKSLGVETKGVKR